MLYTLHNRNSNRFKHAYAKLGRFAYSVLLPLLGVYLNKKHRRVRVLIINDRKEALLVKNWLGHQFWTLPGGGIRLHETPAQAAIREVHEETGISLSAATLAELGTFPNASKRTPFTIVCFTAKIPKQDIYLIGRRRLEMLDIAWFPMDHLPHPHSSTIERALALR